MISDAKKIVFLAAGVFLNADAELDFKTTEEYKIFVTCTGTSSMESFLTVRILDKSVTTPYTVPGIFLKLFTLLVSECEFFFLFFKKLCLSNTLKYQFKCLIDFLKCKKYYRKKPQMIMYSQTLQPVTGLFLFK